MENTGNVNVESITSKSNESLENTVVRLGTSAIYYYSSTLEVVDDVSSYTNEGVAIFDAISYSDDTLIEISKNFLKKYNLSKLTVTTSDGSVFDANETARINLLSAITSYNASSGLISWKLADNSVKDVSIDILKEALDLAIKQVGVLIGVA